MITRVLGLAAWGFAVWLVLTWTVTAEQLAFGAGIALAVAVAMAPLGKVVAPWRLLRPRTALTVVHIAGTASVAIVRANLGLARRIWSPRRPLRSGMLIVPTILSGDGTLAASCLISSLIVDKQIVDLDRDADLLQYHAVDVPRGGMAHRRELVNAPIERLVARLQQDSP